MHAYANIYLIHRNCWNEKRITMQLIAFSGILSNYPIGKGNCCCFFRIIRRLIQTMGTNGVSTSTAIKT